MLNELGKREWLSFLGVSERMVPDVLILRGTRNLKANYERYKMHFQDALEIGSPNGIFEDVLIGYRRGALVGYASVYGDAMASEITHVFGVLGTSLVIQTGCCGGLAEELLPGDVVCVTSAHCGEGAAQYYVGAQHEVRATEQLIASLDGSLVSSVALRKGPIWTTSALLAEGKAEIEGWAQKGYIAVDMESASTLAVAEHFGMQSLSLLFTFDNPRCGNHILLTDAGKAVRRKQGEQAMIELAFSVIDGRLGIEH